MYTLTTKNKPICKPKKGAMGYFCLSCTIHMITQNIGQEQTTKNIKEQKSTTKQKMIWDEWPFILLIANIDLGRCVVRTPQGHYVLHYVIIASQTNGSKKSSDDPDFLVKVK